MQIWRRSLGYGPGGAPASFRVLRTIRRDLGAGVVRAYEDHPVRRFFDRGLIVTINTDDPAMFGNSLAEEYRLLSERFGFRGRRFVA